MNQYYDVWNVSRKSLTFCFKLKSSRQRYFVFKANSFLYKRQKMVNRDNYQQAIYKTWNTRTGNRIQGRWGRIFPRVPEYLLEESGKCYHFNISGNVQEDFGEYAERLRGLLEKTAWRTHKGEQGEGTWFPPLLRYTKKV